MKYELFLFEDNLFNLIKIVQVVDQDLKSLFKINEVINLHKPLNSVLL